MSILRPTGSFTIDAELAALIVASARDYAIFTMGLDGGIVSWSAGAERMIGYGPIEAVGMNARALFTEPDLAAGADLRELEHANREGWTEDNRWHVRRGGQWFWGVGMTVAFEQEGVRALLRIVRDETPAKLALEQSVLLLNELNHRTKNTLATVQSIAEQTLKSGSVDPITRERLLGRLMALSKAHDVLVQESWAGAGLAEVVAEAVAAHRSIVSTIEIAGPPVRLSPALAVSISMALHELATNAVEYGALSSLDGRIAISWTDVHDSEGGRFLSLLWHEHNGPPVTPPCGRGFGSRLLARIFAEIGGTTCLEYLPDGLRCVIDLPLSGSEGELMLEVPQDPRRPHLDD